MNNYTFEVNDSNYDDFLVSFDPFLSPVDGSSMSISFNAQDEFSSISNWPLFGSSIRTFDSMYSFLGNDYIDFLNKDSELV